MEPARIHWLDMARSEAVETKVREKADWLSRFADDIQTCEVWLESQRGHHRKGDLYGVRIRLRVPGEEIDVDLQPEEEDVYVSIREAFNAARRKVEDYERRRRGNVKTHPRAKRRQVSS